ncbi:hypothetical protein FOZ62_018662 [Perkinsus olseni]|uniref:Uncharacterized protein n=1 Tax=Perkinsus olseni TaxID=32597 RepID=A0A7J6QWJ0_PEROL|nr:hypothetical protein FOZ62_018662 [Perkinsus olseni]
MYETAMYERRFPAGFCPRPATSEDLGPFVLPEGTCLFNLVIAMALARLSGNLDDSGVSAVRPDAPVEAPVEASVPHDSPAALVPYTAPTMTVPALMIPDGMDVSQLSGFLVPEAAAEMVRSVLLTTGYEQFAYPIKPEVLPIVDAEVVDQSGIFAVPVELGQLNESLMTEPLPE